jgi:hypothetical protein
MTRIGRSNLLSFKKLASLASGISLLVLLSGWVNPAAAQGALQLGTPGSGSLSTSDPKMDDDSHYDLWTFRGRSGQSVRVTLRSDDFDAFLSFGQMSNNEFDELDSDDDGAGGTDSRLVVTLSSEAEYVIRVNSLSEGETGDYTVVVEEDTGESEEVENGGGESDPLPEPTPIQSGQAVNGELSEDDPKMDDDSHYDLYSFNARRGQQAVVTLRSTAFDSYLAVGQIDGGSFTTEESDDDSGGGDDSQVTLRVPRDGVYVIRANSLFADVTGAYTVELRLGDAPPMVEPVTQAIRYGQTVSGQLSAEDPQMDDDSHYDLYKFTGRSGEKVVILMKSPDFDTYLVLGRMEDGEFVQVERDDDNGGGTDSKIEVTLEGDGEYVIRANSLFSKGLGNYTVNLTRGR